jgi:hypothetical protein
MASITRTAGTIFAGVNQDTDLGSLVSIAGAQPTCFGILLKDLSANPTNIDAEGEADETIDIVLRLISGGGSGATNVGAGSITYFQVETGTPWQISVMTERNSWTATTLQAAIRALGTTVGTNSKDISLSTVTNVGFKLALS